MIAGHSAIVLAAIAVESARRTGDALPVVQDVTTRSFMLRSRRWTDLA